MPLGLGQIGGVAFTYEPLSEAPGVIEHMHGMFGSNSSLSASNVNLFGVLVVLPLALLINNELFYAHARVRTVALGLS